MLWEFIRLNKIFNIKYHLYRILNCFCIREYCGICSKHKTIYKNKPHLKDKNNKSFTN